jgi:hypothetical protein
MKYVVERNKENHKEVNSFFNELYPKKNFSDTGTKGYPGTTYYRKCDYIHYPANESGRTHDNFKWTGHKLITLQELKDILKKETMLPDNYYVLSQTKEQNGEIARYCENTYNHFYGVSTSPFYYGLGKELNRGHTDIKQLNSSYTIYTFQEWKDLLNKKEMKKIIGYKFKKGFEQFEKAAVAIVASHTAYKTAKVFSDFPDSNRDGKIFGQNSLMSQKLKEAKVLDLWFEPVYENEFKIGDWVTWTGMMPVTGKIKSGPTYDCYALEAPYDKTHDSLHYSYLRKATQEEIDSTKTLTISVGTPLTEVTIKKNGDIYATVGGNNFNSNITDLSSIKNSLLSKKFIFGLGGYDVVMEDITVRVGCKSTNFQVKLSEITKILEEYKKL